MSEDKKFNNEAMLAFFRILSANHGGSNKIAMPPADSLDPGDRIKWNLEPGMDHPEMKIIKFKDIVDQRYKKLKEEYGYGGTEKAFDELKKQLIKEGKKPKKYGLNDDAYAFNRAYNKRKNKRLRE